MKLENIIYQSLDWQDLKDKIGSLSNKEKGYIFEVFIKYFLQSHPDYVSTLRRVWLFSELNPKLKKALNIPSNDQGIDLVAETTTGDYWAIQCKYLDDENQRLTHNLISTFGNLAFAISKKFSFGLVCTTAERFSKAYNDQQTISFCTSQTWRNLTIEQFENIRKLASGDSVKITPYKPYPHQQRAITNAVEHFIEKKESRGKLIFPCGSGKSLTGFWIAEKFEAKKIIVAMPSLALVRQTLNTWLREVTAKKMNVEWLCVCSDESIGNQDDLAILVQDLGIPCFTDITIISNWLKRKSSNIKVVFTTYQSGMAIAEAAIKTNTSFDLGIMDEAHKTVGQKGKLFSHLLYNTNISITKRVFMTATERRYLGSRDEIVSMDNPTLYGDTFESLTFKEALEITPPILSDYRILTVVVKQSELQELIKRNSYVRPTKGIWNNEVEAHTLTSIIALRKAMQKFPIKHAVSFHSSIARAKAFEENQRSISEAIPDFEPIESFHVTGATPTAERSKTINAFSKSPKALITNARCLTEGVDIPNIDCILFADPKRSTIDIVQAVGRALRISNGKQFGYVIIPVLSNSKNEKQLIADESYSDLLLTLQALASNDERIIEYFSLKNEKGLSIATRSIGDELVEILAEHIDLQKLVEEVDLKVWNRLAKLCWRPFADARDFVRSLNLKNEAQWRQYCKSENKPVDIPMSADKVYKNKGWISFGDWLGTGRVAYRFKEYKSFFEARKFVHSLHFKNRNEWSIYCRSEIMPEDIPKNPNETYKNSGWINMGDWLGTGNIAPFLREYRPFIDARKFVQSLNLKSGSEWKQFCKIGEKPEDIPAAPNIVYKNDGWVSMGDWLGTGRIADQLKKFRTFVEARKFVHSMNFKNSFEWNQFRTSGKRPLDIPSTPNAVYKNKGWINMGDWLGTGSVATYLKKYRSFIEARKYVHTLNIKNEAQWRKYCRSGKMPIDIPHSPEGVYKNRGWISRGDWFGTGTIASPLRRYMSFIDARDFVHSLKLKGQSEWNEYCKSGKLPKSIPSNPHKKYKEAGWTNMGDWLGTGNMSNRLKSFRPFLEARKFVQSLKLKGESDWRQYSKSGEKPKDIPAGPSGFYKNQGWQNWGDWLGTETIATKSNEYMSFTDARKFIHSLQLKNEKEWRQYCKSATKPKNIPNTPERVYKNKGWISKGDWLGTGIIAPRLREYRPFNEAKKFVNSLGLKNNTEWIKYCKSGRKPNDIPSGPERTYKNEGWKGLGDWLGTGSIATFLIEYRPFTSARKFVHSLKLKSSTEWNQYCKSGKKPNDIPVAPGQDYKNKGWINWGDWLGTGRIADQNKEYRPFVNARKFAHSLKLKNSEEWNYYCLSGKKPEDIPNVPRIVYKEKGWVSWGEWLGTGRISNQKREFRAFVDAKKFIHSLKLKNQYQWKEYCKTKLKPNDIPTNPNRTYKDEGWKDFGDWLGTGAIATRSKEYKSFLDARKFVHSLQLKSGSEWREYCKLGKKPSDIPAKAYRTYKNKGWINMKDWIGK